MTDTRVEKEMPQNACVRWCADWRTGLFLGIEIVESQTALRKRERGREKRERGRERGKKRKRDILPISCTLARSEGSSAMRRMECSEEGINNCHLVKFKRVLGLDLWPCWVPLEFKGLMVWRVSKVGGLLQSGGGGGIGGW